LFGLSEQARLTIGQFPEQMPIPIPISSSAQIIGSINVPPNSFQILLEDMIPVESIKNFYQDQLIVMGWIEKELIPSDYRGFSHAPEAVKRQLRKYSKFWHEPENLELSIKIDPYESSDSKRATILLHLECGSKNEAIKVLNLPPFPPLSDPSGTRHLPSSGGTYDHYSRFMCLETELEHQHLYTHYKTQFETENWVQIDKGEHGALIWGNWRLIGLREQIWVATLNVVKLGGDKSQYIVQVRVVRQP